MGHKKAVSLEKADQPKDTAFKLHDHYIYFLRKLQEMRNLLAFPFIVVGLGYIALFALFIFWRFTL